ncbi:DUF4124 domain-containing protein [Legionella londiniensis]|uniref:DUF4124 domain-containing protein n=1 Tax=Legionella londiniensis TaxID=45068 RepID=A0A0W0VM94_9GAMM|nr:DUF4124 domain-containing protein [Legionella londiniensis]KTD21269.1 hypothetical protein Llon_1367 [Legionella londiniensis]STX93295.1 Uncharacterised protein [Legionella londiniensis]
MRRLFILISLMIFLPILHAEIYKWTDSEGNVHFSDKPHPGAEKIDLPPVQTFSPPPTPPPAETMVNPEVAAKTPDYEIAISQPENDATIRNNQGSVSVALEIQPRLNPGDKVQIVFDGTPIGEPQTATVFQLSDINRGAHTLAAQIVGSDGKVISTSETITIYMHRPRVGMVPGTRRTP